MGQWAWPELIGGVLLGWLTALPIGLLANQRLRRETDRLRFELAQAVPKLDQLAFTQAELEQARTQKAVLEEQLRQEVRRVAETEALLDQAEARLADAFKALSQDVLDQNNRLFLSQAEQVFKRLQESAAAELEKKQMAVETLVKPIGDSLDRVQSVIGEIEKARREAYGSLSEQIKALLTVHLPGLYRETQNLARALRQPAARGRWGEVQLKRVVEMAGMVEHCDFQEQVTHGNTDSRLRPDLIVRLPNRRLVVVDAKAPLEAYLKAVEAEDGEESQSYLLAHARQLKRHIQQLSHKSYFDQFERTPEFVVLFIPGEAFFAAALHADPNLIEYGVENKVIPASPTTLIALLKAIAYGWQQEKMAQSAEQIARLGKELYERIAKVAEHWQRMGEQLEKTVKAYNDATRSLETRLLPTARKFQELRQAEETLPALELVEQNVLPLPPLEGEGIKGQSP
ncbi:MAG: DNA recombination protein RmuC [Methylohalobius sp.]|nr:DNA recombination protein RmuC [Methylohalobius sp.]